MKLNLSIGNNLMKLQNRRKGPETTIEEYEKT
jgi:hypothetical protein